MWKQCRIFMHEKPTKWRKKNTTTLKVHTGKKWKKPEKLSNFSQMDNLNLCWYWFNPLHKRSMAIGVVRAGFFSHFVLFCFVHFILMTIVMTRRVECRNGNWLQYFLTLNFMIFFCVRCMIRKKRKQLFYLPWIQWEISMDTLNKVIDSAS